MLKAFNAQKCGLIHFRFDNNNIKYKLSDYEINEITEECDLVIIVDSSLNFSRDCSKVVKEANNLLGLIKRFFLYTDREILLPLYKCLTRAKLKYYVQAWRPYLIKDINLLEHVQRRATKLIFKDKTIPYEVRLNSVSLTSLESRRER